MLNPGDEQRGYVLHGVRVPGSRGRPFDLSIHGSSIEAVGDLSAVTAYAPVIACEGLFAVPGLIDLHIHLAGAMGLHDATSTDVTAGARELLRAGVTTARDLGGPPRDLARLRSIATSSRELPRLFISGPQLTAPGGHPVVTVFRGRPHLARVSAREVAGIEQARSAVREVAGMGVDCIKVILTNRSVTQADASLPKLDLPALRAIVEEAHERGLPVVAHTLTAADVADAAAAEVDGVEHGIVLDDADAYDDDLVELLVARRIAYVPTLAAIERVAPIHLRRAQANVARLAKAGVSVGAGSDAGNPGVPLGSGLLRELELLVEAGLGPALALRAATHNGAEQLRIPETAAGLSPGARADVLFVAGDPLESVSHLRSVRVVLKAGSPVSLATNGAQHVRK